MIAPPGVGDRRYKWVISGELSQLPDSLALPTDPQGCHFQHPYRDRPHFGIPVDHPESALLAVLGLEGVHEGEAFRCILHDDNRASAAIYRGDDNLLRYRCFAGCCGRQGWLSLAGVHAWKVGRRCHLSRIEIAIWAADLRVRAGLLDPVWIPDPEAGVPDHLVPTWDGFRRLIGVRWMHRPGEPTPFAREFAAAWCQLSERQVRSQFIELVDRGAIRDAGGDRLRLWLPGRGVVPV